MDDDSFASSIPHRKEVPAAYKPNSFRVLTSDAGDLRMNPNSSTQLDKPPPAPHSRSTNILGQPIADPLPYDPWAYGRPTPLRSRVLQSNVRTMMDPVCDVVTNDPEEKLPGCWWRHPRSSDLQPPKTFTLDTTFRKDFQKHSGVSGNTRHSSNPNTTPAIGGVPVTWLKNPDGRKRFMKEGISYEHEYDCRLDPNYPPRGKRQGNFVCDMIPEENVNQRLVPRYVYSTRLMPSREQMQNRAAAVARKSSGSLQRSRISNSCRKNELRLGQETLVAL